MQKGVTCVSKIAFRLIHGGKIRPSVRRARIQRKSGAVGANGTRGVGILEVVLPIAAQEIPVARVGGLKASGALIAFGRLQTGCVCCVSISNTEIGEGQGEGATSDDNYPTLDIGGETQNHSPVSCLDRFGVARKISVTPGEQGLARG